MKKIYDKRQEWKPDDDGGGGGFRGCCYCDGQPRIERMNDVRQRMDANGERRFDRKESEANKMNERFENRNRSKPDEICVPSE